MRIFHTIIKALKQVIGIAKQKKAIMKFLNNFKNLNKFNAISMMIINCQKTEEITKIVMSKKLINFRTHYKI